MRQYTKCLTHVIRVLEGEERVCGVEVNIWKNNGWRYADLAKHTATDSWSSVKLKQDRLKETHAQTHQSQTAEN